jgi:toxin ParE1/3/4
MIAAVQVLAHSSHVGRPAKAGKREIVISSGARGYVALYRYVEAIDTVFVVALRAQREVRYERRRK